MLTGEAEMRVFNGQREAPKRGLLACALIAAAILGMLVAARPALASARWRPNVRVAPTQLPLEGQGFVDAIVENGGDTAISALTTPVTITDVLPPGVTAISVKARRQVTAEAEGNGPTEFGWNCSGEGTSEISCTYDPAAVLGKNEPIQKPEERHVISPYDFLELRIRVEVKASTGTFANRLSVQGGRETQQSEALATEEGAEVPPGPTVTQPIKVSGTGTGFGIEDEGFAIRPEDSSGNLETEAGSHPFQLTTTLNLNQTFEAIPAGPLLPSAPALVRNLHINLPPGLLGNVNAVKQCSDVAFSTEQGFRNECPEDSAIGVARVTLEEPQNFTLLNAVVPVFNLVPLAGEPARFGFFAYHVPVVLKTRVRTGSTSGAAGDGDYGVEVSASEVTQVAQVLGSEVTLWGAPGDPSHDESRGWSCINGGFYAAHGTPCGPSQEDAGSAFLTLPTTCTTQTQATAAAESWPTKGANEPGLGRASTTEAAYEFPGEFGGCDSLPFSPTIRLKPTTSQASTPTGLEVDVHVPQESTVEAAGRAASAVKATTVTLPAGVQLSPSAANGLEACSEDEMGLQKDTVGSDPYSPKTEEPLRFSPGPVGCPSGSKVGVVKVHTPLLKNDLEGSVYLAEQENNPFHSLVALYIVAEDPPEIVQKGEASGIRVKLAGEVKLDPQTGQISSTFQNTPQVPFEDFTVNFDEGPRASVATPPLCGSYTTSALFTPWSGGASQPSTSNPTEFSLSSGPGGSGCANPQPFSPSFTAGSTNLQAGAFSPFTVTINRPDTDQALKSVSVTLPPGAAAVLKSATQCPEAQANAGTCGPESLIGHATAVSGLGPDPYTVTGGQVYITGPYNGAPFGLSIVTPANAGPFHLGNVVVRSSISVDKSTAAVTINTTLPTMVSSAEHPNTGIPLQLRSINVVVDRPNFEFNPTNCNPLSVTGTLGGANGASHPVSAPFHVANCSALPFHPTLTASTQGNASKANGASLTVKVTSTPGQANIAKTRLVLPIALPSRLTTIQKACLAKVFEANPAGCSDGSNIGTATVHTPVLKSPLTGPAYLVSHGNAAFPDVEFVLQGEGITLILDGQTDIKKGITTSTFNTVPDAPVTTFETVLPEGPHSALTSNVPENKKFSLCGTKLVIPTTITGQNGVVIQQQTKIPVSGCKGVLGIKETKAQKLKKALKACRKKFKHNKKKRASCEKQAHKKYGPKKAKKKKSAKHK